MTAPDEREQIAQAICAADEATLDYERRWPDPPFGPDGHYDEQWKAYLPHADAVLARLSELHAARDARVQAEPSAPVFEFDLRAIERDTTGYYHPRWDRAQSMTVRAATKQAAINKADAVLGPPRHGRGWHWEFKVDAIREQGDAS